MVEQLGEMLPGTIGFRATGRVTADEYRDVLLPAVEAAVEAGEVRMLFAVGPGFERFEPGALVQDSKMGLTLGIRHWNTWKRTAVVTDVDWIEHSVRMFMWLTPGDVKLFGLDGLDEAKAWVAEG
ncbi:MAG TPA: STAS/SEC14 domain-containing protein [Solirubrobacteraceae bacterium]